MTQLSASHARNRRNTHLMREGEITGTDSQTIYQGAMVCHAAAAGTISEGADTSGMRIAGIATKDYTTSTSNTTKIKYEWGHEELMTHDGNLTNTSPGKNCCILDDATVTNAGTASNDVEAGMVTEYVSATQVWVAIGVFALDNA